MKKILIFILCLIPALMVAQISTKVGQPPINNAGWISGVANYAYGWDAPKIIYAFNSRGDTISPYELVIWDTASVLEDSAKVNGNGNFTVYDSLKTFRWFNLFAENIGTASACTVKVYGKDTSGASTIVPLILNGVNQLAYAPCYYRKVDSLRYRHATNDTIRVRVRPAFSVTVTASASVTTVAGVAQALTAKDYLVPVLISGWSKVYLQAASVSFVPGELIGTGTIKGYGITAGVVTGKGVGTTLESGNINKAYWAYIHLF